MPQGLLQMDEEDMCQAASALQTLVDTAATQQDSAALQYVDRTAAALQVNQMAILSLLYC